ncbi:MAG: AAA family ATPase [Pseudomonadota bacterium]
MRLRALRVADVGGFVEPVALEGFSGRLDLLLGPNETGKSTLFRALQAVFFQKHSAKGKFLTRLTPVRGGTPLIEADFEIGGGNWRVTKQFGSGKTAMLQAVGGGASWRNADAEAKLQELLELSDAAPGRFGALWVGQRHGLGVPVLDVDPDTSRARSAGEQQALLAAIEQEIDDTAGGTLASTVRDLLLEMAKPLLTDSIAKPQPDGPKAKPRRDGPLDRALRHCSDLEEALEVARTRAAETAESRLRLEAIERELSQVMAPDVAKKRVDRVGELRRKFEAAQKAADRLKLLTTERDRADAVATREEAAFQQYCEGLETVHSLLKRRDALRDKRDHLVADIKTLEDQQVVFAHDVDHAEQTVVQARAVYDAQVYSQRCAEIRKEQSRLRLELDRARRLEDDVHRFHAVLRSSRVTSELRETARRAQRDIELAENRMDAASTWLNVEYLPGKSGDIAIGDAPLSAGTPVRITSPTDVVIAGVGRLMLSPGDNNDIGDAKAQCDAAQRLLSDALQAADVADLDALEAMFAARAEAERALSDAVATLNGIAPDGLRTFEARLGELEDMLTDLGDGSDIEAEILAGDDIGSDGVAADIDPGSMRTSVPLPVLEARVRQFKLDRDAARARLSQAEQTFKTSALALEHCQDKLRDCETKILEFEGHLGPSDERANMSDALRIAGEDARLVAREAQLAVVAARDDVLDGAALEALQAQVKEAEQCVTEAADRAQLLKDERAERLALIMAFDEDGQSQRVDQLEGELARARREATRLTNYAEGLKLAIGALDRARAQSHDRFARPVYRALAPFLEALFDDAEVVFDKDFRPVEICRNGADDAFDLLSDGTQEQIGLLVRLAFGRVFAEAGQSTPIILDDPLAYADDERLAKTFRALEAASAHQQIFLMSCRQSVFRKLGGHTVQLDRWYPDAGGAPIRSSTSQKLTA